LDHAVSTAQDIPLRVLHGNLVASLTRLPCPVKCFPDEFFLDRATVCGQLVLKLNVGVIQTLSALELK